MKNKTISVTEYISKHFPCDIAVDLIVNIIEQYKYQNKSDDLFSDLNERHDIESFDNFSLIDMFNMVASERRGFDEWEEIFEKYGQH